MQARFAEYADLDRVLHLCLQSLCELGYGKDIEPQEVDYNIRRHWNDAPCVVLLSNNQIVGFFGLMLTKPIYSGKVYLKDYMVFILPEYRSLKSLRVLCDAARQFAAQNQLKLEVGYLANAETASKKARLMKLMGFDISAIGGAYG